jgi:hypothetical protein
MNNTLKILMANINHVIRNDDTATIGDGVFDAKELQSLIDLYKAAQLAEEALLFDYGGEPLPSLEKEALVALRAVL